MNKDRINYKTVIFEFKKFKQKKKYKMCPIILNLSLTLTNFIMYQTRTSRTKRQSKSKYYSNYSNRPVWI